MSSPAYAQAVCNQRGIIVDLLGSKYQEKAVALGLAGNGGVVELYTSEDGGWTLLLTQTSGISCMIASGEDWTTIPPEPDRSSWRDS